MGSINISDLYGTGSNAGFDYTIKGVNVVTNYLFGDFLLIALFVIFLFMMRNYPIRDTLLSASILTFGLSLILWIAAFTDFTRVVVCFSLIIASLFMSYIQGE